MVSGQGAGWGPHMLSSVKLGWREVSILRGCAILWPSCRREPVIQTARCCAEKFFSVRSSAKNDARVSTAVPSAGSASYMCFLCDLSPR